MSSQKNEECSFTEFLNKSYIKEWHVHFKDIFGFSLKAFTDVPRWLNFRRVYSSGRWRNSVPCGAILQTKTLSMWCFLETSFFLYSFNEPDRGTGRKGACMHNTVRFLPFKLSLWHFKPGLGWPMSEAPWGNTSCEELVTPVTYSVIDCLL